MKSKQQELYREAELYSRLSFLTSNPDAGEADRREAQEICRKINKARRPVNNGPERGNKAVIFSKNT